MLAWPHLECVQEYHYKLDHLHCSEISFPPEILVEAGAAGREEVVEVHHAVHPGVQEGAEAALSSAYKPRAPPAEPGQSPVVDDVEGRQMGELLTANKEEGVGQVNKLSSDGTVRSPLKLLTCLGEEVPPGEVEGSLATWAGGVVHRLAHPAVLPRHVEAPALQEHPEAEDGLEEIVDQHEAPNLIRFSVLHESKEIGWR